MRLPQFARDIEDYYIDLYFSQFDPHDGIMIFYDKCHNIFIESAFGYRVDIYQLLTPDDVLIFKRLGMDQSFPDRTGKFLVDLVHMEGE